MWFGAFHFPDAHGVDLGGVVNGLLSSNITVIASNNRKRLGYELVFRRLCGGWGQRESCRHHGRGMADWGSPPSSSASVSDSSLSTSLLSWVPTNSLVQIIRAVSAPPTVSNTESLCSHLTLVTCALCPTYFLNLACCPCKYSQKLAVSFLLPEALDFGYLGRNGTAQSSNSASIMRAHAQCGRGGLPQDRAWSTKGLQHVFLKCIWELRKWFVFVSL